MQGRCIILVRRLFSFLRRRFRRLWFRRLFLFQRRRLFS